MSLTRTIIACATVVTLCAGLRLTGLWSHTPTIAAPPTLWALPQFSFLDQDGKTVTNASFTGRVWIADFFFTYCDGICPRMTAVMLDVQKKIKHPAIGLLSFSVDPDRDTPKRLKDYATGLQVDESKWRFVTSNRRAMLDVATALKITDKEKINANVALHSDRLFLLDSNCVVRGVYDSNDPKQMSQLLTDAELLATSPADAKVVATTQPTKLYTSITTDYGPSVEALAKDLVCGMDVMACSKTSHCEWEGRSFYFCGDGCRDRFLKDPNKYTRR